MRKHVVSMLLGVVLGFLIGAGGFAAAQTTASQVVSKVSAAPKASAAAVNETVAVKVVAERDGHLVGTLVARVDGKWVEVELTSGNER